MDVFEWLRIKLIGNCGLSAWNARLFDNLYGSHLGMFRSGISEIREGDNFGAQQIKFKMNRYF